MLILTRRIGENVRIGEDVSVTVLEVKGNQVRLGIAAPKTIAVHREEIFERIAHENHPTEDLEEVQPAKKVVRVVSKRAGRRMTGA